MVRLRLRFNLPLRQPSTMSASSSQPQTANHTAAGQFAPTRWSVVLAAGRGESIDACAALEKLCGTYWPPIYAFVRRQGHSPHDAQDLTQEFFARLLESKSIVRADPSLGRFRTFLLGALKHFLTDSHRKAGAWKRGGGVEIVSLQESEA